MDEVHFNTVTLGSIPDLLALHARFPQRYPHLLVSTAQASDITQYDILFACPQETLRYTHETSFLEQLDQSWQKNKVADIDSPLPFTGGWFVYLGYELAGEIEPSLDLPESTDGFPVAFSTRIPAAIIVDKSAQVAYLMCEDEYSNCMQQIMTDLDQLDAIDQEYHEPIEIAELREDDESAYLQQVKLIKHYIIEGDVFQVNLSRAWKTRLLSNISHASLFHRLTQCNPGPFNALATLDNKAVLSSSPERLIQVRSGKVQTRPIAGTRPRSSNDSQDLALSVELMKHPKERAEHIMLIDLERNDLGRICEPGTVEVNELMVLESYQHVHHIVSNVRGRLKSGMTPGQVIKAVFPGGTITGCPKVRCMEILAELEATGRGAYTGSLGYLNHDGSMDLNILIRTMVRNGDEISFRAGGGIVADSDPVHELNETRAKAKAMIMALQGDI